MNQVALVTDLKVIDSPQAWLWLSRCLVEWWVDIIGLDDTPFISRNKELFIDTFEVEEIRTLNFDALIKKIISFKEIYGARYIFPCYDETTILFSFIKDKLDFLWYTTFTPTKDVLKKISKTHLNSLNIFSAQYRTPKTQHFTTIHEWVEWAQEIWYPVVCKGLVKDAYVCKNEKELVSSIEKISNIWNNGEISFLLQQYIFWRYKNSILCINHDKIVWYAEMSKVGLDVKWATWFGKLEITRDLFDFSLMLTHQYRFGSCIIEIETIIDNDVMYIYEINPRPPAWIYALCLAGLNLPMLLVNNYYWSTCFLEREYFFGRETQEYLVSAMEVRSEHLVFYSKWAAYKTHHLKYPSELL